jgi:hypothetical protein
MRNIEPEISQPDAPSFPDVQLHIVDAPLGAGPESITPNRECGFRAHRFAMPGNDEEKSPAGSIRFHLSSPISKNNSIPRLPKSLLYPPPSRSPEGRLAIVTDAGRDAVDADGAPDEGA